MDRYSGGRPVQMCVSGVAVDVQGGSDGPSIGHSLDLLLRHAVEPAYHLSCSASSPSSVEEQEAPPQVFAATSVMRRPVS